MKTSLIVLSLLVIFLLASSGVLSSGYDVDKVRKILMEKQEQLKNVEDGLVSGKILFSSSKDYGNKENPLLKDYVAEKERQVAELTQIKKTLNFEVEFLKRTWEEETVAALYRTLLQRDPEPTGLAHWVSVLRVNNVKSTIKGIVHSEEYKQKNMKTPEETVKKAYRILLGREVESDAVLSEQVKLAQKNGNLAFTISIIDSAEYAKVFGDYSIPRKQ